jgi:hypothetical protein
MFGRTFRIAILLVMTPLASGCFCCCERPFFFRRFQCCGGGSGCCEPCTTCCGSPSVAHPPAFPVGAPVYTGAPIAAPVLPTAPTTTPQTDRMAPISSTALSR